MHDVRALQVPTSQQLPGWLRPGAKVEVVMTEPGLKGSRYGATLLSSDGPMAEVEYDDLNDDGEAQLRELVPVDTLTPPPPPPPSKWATAITIGSPVQLLHEGGWWSMILSGRRVPTAAEPASFLVRSAIYQTEYWTTEDVLRPQWLFCAEQWKLQGVYIDEATVRQPGSGQQSQKRREPPAGWVAVVHEAPSRTYLTFSGPSGQRARSFAEAWRMHAAEEMQQGSVALTSQDDVASAAYYFNLGEDGVVEATTRDDAGIIGTTFQAANSMWAGYEIGSTACCVRGFAASFPWGHPRSRGPAYIVETLVDCHMYPFALDQLPSELVQAHYRGSKKTTPSKRHRSDSSNGEEEAKGNGGAETSMVVTVPDTPKRSSAPLQGYCIYCLDAVADTVFIHGTTGHRCYCEACSKRWRCRDCPACRRHIDRTIKFYDVAHYDSDTAGTGGAGT